MMVREGSPTDDGYAIYDEDGTSIIVYNQQYGARDIGFAGYRNDDIGTGNPYYTIDWRSSENGKVSDSTRTKTSRAYSYPDYLRIRRTGNTYYSYVSEDAITWELLSTIDTSNGQMEPWAAKPIPPLITLVYMLAYGFVRFRPQAMRAQPYSQVSNLPLW